MEKEPLPTANPSAPVSVLLVEDQATYREILRAALASRFPKAVIHAVEGVEEALALLDAEPVDVILTDMSLSDGMATDLIARSRALVSDHLAVVVLSNYTPQQLEPLLSSCEVHAVVAKEQGLAAIAEAVTHACPRLAGSMTDAPGSR